MVESKFQILQRDFRLVCMLFRQAQNIEERRLLLAAMQKNIRQTDELMAEHKRRLVPAIDEERPAVRLPRAAGLG